MQLIQRSPPCGLHHSAGHASRQPGRLLPQRLIVQHARQGLHLQQQQQQQPQPQRLWRRTGAVAAPGVAADNADSVADNPNSAAGQCLQNLMVWLVSNGVQGIGSEDSLLALYEDEQGDRGIVADTAIAADQVLVRVPLRLAITDVMQEEEQQRVVGQGALWQDRLVAKLLQEWQKGKESAWYPYLQALPRAVPSALDTFTAEEAEQVQLPAAVSAIKAHAAKMQDSWSSCRPDAIGGADLSTYCWAHTVIMSRTFGNASPQGGVGVRMCVPLIDMLNHAGDEAIDGLLAGGGVVGRDNVRWDVVGPDNSASGTWEMVLKSTKGIEEGSPLLLSYREGPNEEFLLNYGFVPPSNPHDTVQLFGDLGEALEHLWMQELAQGKSPADLRERHAAAHDAGLQVLQEEVAAAAAGLTDSNSWGQLLQALEPVQVASGSRVSGSLIAALEVLHHGDMAAVGATVASLAWQQLRALPTSLLADLAWLVLDGLEQQDPQQVELFGGLLRHYVQALAPSYEPELWRQLVVLATDSSRSSPGDSSSDSSSNSSSGSSLGAARSSKKRAVPGRPLPATEQQQQQQQQEQPVPAAVDKVAALPLQQLAAAVLQEWRLQQQRQQQHLQQQQSQADPVESIDGDKLQEQERGQEQQRQQQQQPPQQQSTPSLAVGNCRPSALRLAMEFRVNKKQLLADVLLAAPVPLQQLVQQEQQLAAYKAASAAARLSPSRVELLEGSGAPCGLPWHC